MNNNFRRINYASIPSLHGFATPHSTLEENRGAYYPYAPRETPLGLISSSGSRVDILVLNNRTQTSSAEEESSRVREEEQANVIKKLKKEVYNPEPKRISKRLCLYYRDQATNIVNQMAREKEEQGKRCAVCLEDFEPKEMVMVTPCNHMFHEDCILPWVKTHAHCPVCRHPIAPNPAPNTDFYTQRDLISILRAMGTAM